MHILTLSCRDGPGITAEVTGLLAAHGANIVEAQQFGDAASGAFFMRVGFVAERGEEIAAALVPLADRREMRWTLRDHSAARKVLILVSRADHCLADLLYRQRLGELAMDVVGVVGNHPREALAHVVLSAVPYHHLPVTAANRAAQEASLLALVTRSGAELVVLARYMQVLSDDLARALAGRCINIHHSFLPGFKGARPYHQAHARGVKMIGATAHYVTPDLDEGPIIHQDVEPASHADGPAELIRKGRDIERRVLAEAVRLHLGDRVLLNGARTVVFRS